MSRCGEIINKASNELLARGGWWPRYLMRWMLKAQGFADPRLVEDRPLAITDAELAQRTGNINFFSATYRLFKLDGLESACEDYGQAVIYKGSIPGQAHRFALDKHHDIQAGKVFPVCGNTWRMLHDTRFQQHFQFVGDLSQHYGLFEGCGSSMPFDRQTSASAAGACC